VFFDQLNITGWHDVVVNVNFWGVQNSSFLCVANTVKWADGLPAWIVGLRQSTQVDSFNLGVINGPSEHSPFNLKSSHKLNLGKTLRYPNVLGQVKAGLIPKNSAHSVFEFF
jgi:hypothetical protein